MCNGNNIKQGMWHFFAQYFLSVLDVFGCLPVSQKYLICATVLSTGLLFQLPQLRCHVKKWNWKHDAVLRSRSCQCGAGLWNGPPCLAYLSVCLPAYSHLVYCQSSISLLSTFCFTCISLSVCICICLPCLPVCFNVFLLYLLVCLNVFPPIFLSFFLSVYLIKG